MIVTIDPKDRRAVYQQVADSIRAFIAAGQLAEEQALPPVRQLAVDLGVNFNTIAAAYRELRDDGLLTVKHGSRARVAPRTAGKHSEKELRRPLRDALAKMVLAGFRRGDILSMVNDELRGMVTEGKRDQ